jgi:hypothetical protein
VNTHWASRKGAKPQRASSARDLDSFASLRDENDNHESHEFHEFNKTARECLKIVRFPDIIAFLDDFTPGKTR